METIKKSIKFWMGPIRSTTCSNCEAKISIPYLSLFSITVFMLFFSIVMNTDTFIWLKVVSGFILSVIYIYAFYKLTPLIVKSRVGEKKKVLYHLKNGVIMVVYFILTMALFMSISSPKPIWFYREEITNSLIEVNDILMNLEEQILEEGELKNLTTYELMFAIEQAEIGIEKITFKRYGRIRMSFYINSWQITQPLGRLRTLLLQGESLDVLDKKLLNDIIEISKSAHIRDQSIYKFSLISYKLPDELSDYFEEMYEIYEQYIKHKQ
jgi:hypothetical protein